MRLTIHEWTAYQTLKDVKVMVEQRKLPTDAINSWIDYAMRQIIQGAMKREDESLIES
jgi:hypothetical protein